MLTGNKGEWSEIYVLLRLLADGKIYAADIHFHRRIGRRRYISLLLK